MRNTLMSILMVSLAVAGSPELAWAACDVTSAGNRAALVELYTSEGCSSCPPADKKLAALNRSGYRLDQVVPIALHVDYWDYIGWRDPYAQAGFSQRQQFLVSANHHRTSFTPHFFASGTEVQDWPEDLDAQIHRINATPAGATLHLNAKLADGNTVALSADATAAASASGDPLDLYVAVIEDRLKSQVVAGENRGALLEHDHVVRNWVGPIPLTQGRAMMQQAVTLAREDQVAHLGLAGFVQNRKTGEVVQAAGELSCLK